VTINTDGSKRAITFGTPSDFGYDTAAGNIVAGHTNNTVRSGKGVVIAGGGLSDGEENTVDADFTTVSGGRKNTASGWNATVCGGYNNTASGDNSVVIGGGTNGNPNTASGTYAVVAGGVDNTADGRHSFACGRQADASGNDGAFVRGDGSAFSVTADATNQVVFQAGGGMNVYTDRDTSNNTGAELASGSGSWASLSTKTAKSDIEPVNGPDALTAVESLDIATWRYDAEDEDIRHIGPMAEDFHDAFGLGHDEQRISNVDADGVALAAIQGLSQQLDETQAELDAKDDRIDDLEAENADIRAENEALRERVAAIEAELGIENGGGEVPADD
jgi:hypothetical protein